MHENRLATAPVHRPAAGCRSGGGGAVLLLLLAMAMAMAAAAAANERAGKSTPGAVAGRKPRYSPGRRALSSRSVNSVWLVRTPTTDKKQVATGGPVRAFSDVVAESPFTSPAVGWIQRAVLNGITPQSNDVLRSPDAGSPASSAGDSPALEWKIARDVDTAMQDPRANLDDTLIEQAVASTLRDFAATIQDAGSTPGPVPASLPSTPMDATPRATPPTVAASGGFDVTTPLGEDLLSCNVELAAQLSSASCAEEVMLKARSDCLPRYSCTLLGFREVCKQDPLHPAAFPQTFSLFVIEVALPDHEFGRAKLVVATKRFSEFVEFDLKLRESMQSENLGRSTEGWAPAPLPPKRLWPTRASVIAERQHGLQNYLDWIVTLEAETPRRMLLEWLLPYL